ncbi:MAG: hypothetical protein ACR2IL_03340 [Chitinophagaceae bacterium]
MNIRWILFLLPFFWMACAEEDYIPKPRGYARIDFPQKNYRPFNGEGYPYNFEYPAYGEIIKDTLFFNEKTENPWWINVDFKQWGGRIYLSYKEIGGANTLPKLLEDSYKMSHYHTKKADYINEPEFHTPNGVHGLFYDVGGNAASALQFYATDSHQHFLRGALYFDVTPNVDSLKPINEFLRKDIEHFIQTLSWK